MKLKKYHYWILSILLFLGIWELLCIVMNSFALPSVADVAVSFAGLSADGTWIPHIIASLERTMVGFLLGLAAGIFFGFLLGLNHFARKTINPIIEVLRPIPPIAWIPLAILWFGIGNFSAFFIIFIAAFFPIFTNVFFGVKSLPTIYSQVRKNYGLSTMQYFRHIVWPFSTPFLIAGAKTSIGFSWMAVIAAEMISANEGLGYFIEINRVLLRPERVIAAMLIIGLIGYCLHQAIVAIEKRKLKWRAVAYE